MMETFGNESIAPEQIPEVIKLYKMFEHCKKQLPLGHPWLENEGLVTQMKWLFHQAMSNHNFETKIQCMETYGVTSTGYDEAKSEYIRLNMAGMMNNNIESILKRTHVVEKVDSQWFECIAKKMLLKEEDFDEVFFKKLHHSFEIETVETEKKQCRDIVMMHLALKSSLKYNMGIFQNDDEKNILLTKARVYLSTMLKKPDMNIETFKTEFWNMFNSNTKKSSTSSNHAN